MVKYVVILLLLVCCSCGSSARLKMKDGSFTEGEILRSTSGEIIVKAKGGPEKAIKRSDVEDIDHPGNVALVGGIMMVVYGAAFTTFGIVIVVAADEQQALAERQSGLVSVYTSFGAFIGEAIGWGIVGGGIGVLAVGIPSIVWGSNIWTQSKDRVEVPGIDSVEISIGSGMGLSIKASF